MSCTKVFLTAILISREFLEMPLSLRYFNIDFNTSYVIVHIMNNNLNNTANNRTREKIFNILKTVEKPARYIGGEINSIVKPSAKLRLAMCFPDLYEIGIGNLGMSILYEAINSVEYAACERVYSVGHDFEAALIANDISLYSLETYTPVAEFDVLGFTLQYELLATNILQVLSLSKITLERTERAEMAAQNNEHYPIVIAGGPCVYNPLPLSRFIDVFFMGEYDNKITEIVELIQNAKEQGRSRAEIIEILSKLEYAYAFAHPKPSVKRYFVDDLDHAIYAKKPIVPIHEAIQNRLTIEIARGCTHGCRFCAAGSVYRPVRNRSFNKIMEIIESTLAATGASEINLASLSSDDYPNIGDLVKYLQDKGRDEGFSLSLPSLHVDSFSSDSIIPIAEFKKTGLTFALEAGSDETRRRINKVMNAEAIFNIAGDLKRMGYKTIKLYFMLGLTDDPKAEASAIAQTLEKMSGIIGKSMKVNAAINVFVPKPHTVLQYSRQLADEEAMDYIMSVRTFHYKYNNISVKFNPPRMSVIEALISRGDERIGEVILNAYKLGCRLDSWIEHLDYEKWILAAEQAGFKVEDFLAGRSRDEKLPWDFVDVGITKNYLDKEYGKYESAEFTDDCRYSSCNACGIDYKSHCSKDIPQNDASRYEVPVYNSQVGNLIQKNIYNVEAKIFARFKKTSTAALLGHFDLRRLIVVSLKILGIRITMTSGFHPLPKVVFTEPLSFAIESECEYFEISCYERPRIYDEADVKDFIEKLNNTLPANIDIEHLEIINGNVKKINLIPKDSTYKISTSDNNKAFELISDKEAMATVSERLGKYQVSRDDDYIYLNIIHSESKPFRYKDFSAVLIENDITINSTLKMFS